jgi:hypothetical protein
LSSLYLRLCQPDLKLGQCDIRLAVELSWPNTVCFAVEAQKARDGAEVHAISLGGFFQRRAVLYLLDHPDLWRVPRAAAALSRKQRAAPAVTRIFDGEKEAKLLVACSNPPKGRARWTLRMLENKVVELGIVDRASDSTIGRALKKHSQAASAAALGHPAEGQQRLRSGDGRCARRVHAAP